MGEKVRKKSGKREIPEDIPSFPEKLQFILNRELHHNGRLGGSLVAAAVAGHVVDAFDYIGADGAEIDWEIIVAQVSGGGNEGFSQGSDQFGAVVILYEPNRNAAVNG